MIVITGRVTAKPGSFDTLRVEGLAHSARSRGEDGCLSHRCYVDAAEPEVLFFYEEWRDRPALDAHFEQKGSQAFMAAVREFAARGTPLRIMPIEERRHPYDRRR